MTNFDDLKLAVEALSGGKNTVKLDDLGMPSVVVPFAKLKYADVITGGTQDVLPAFIVDGQEKDVIYVSKYLNIVANSRAYSLPMKNPAASMNFDTALSYCRNKGAGWHLNTNATWAAIALWCKKNGTMPRGNNNYGEDHGYPHEKGVPTLIGTDGRPNRTATGSGPVTWYHNHADSGIADLNGNVWEWVGGLRLQAGEIQIIPNNNAVKLDCNMGATSAEWKAILPDGTLVDPGTAGTLKWDYVSSKVTLATAITTQADASRSNTFETIASAAGVTAPQLLKGLALHPADASGYEGDYIYMNNGAGLERLPYRGGYWSNTSGAGVFNLHLNSPRTYASTGIGFRAAFYE